MKDYFKDDKILIAGASGLLGRNLFEHLKEQGFNVVGTCNSRPYPDLVSCDLTDYKQTKELFDKEKPQYVFMLAAVAYGIGITAGQPERLIRENLAIHSNLLELCYYNKVKKVFECSSSTVYQECDHEIKESELDLNLPPYKVYFGNGWMKRYVEKLCEFYKRLGLNIVVIRPGNIYGKYDKYVNGHFIPEIIKRLVDGENPLVVWGDGSAFRNLIYAPDLVRDVLLIMKYYNSVIPLNVASDTNISVKDTVDLLIKISGYKGSVVFDFSKPEAIKYRGLDTTNFTYLFGIQKYTPLEEGLTATYNWIKNER